MPKQLIPLTLVLIAWGCSPSAPTIDGTSEQAFKASIATAVEQMSPDEKERFKRALMAVMFSGALRGSGDLDAGRHAVHGLTAAAVIALHESANAGRAIDIGDSAEPEQRRQQAMAGIEEMIAGLEQRRAAAEVADANLKKFCVLGARFYYQESQHSRVEPAAEIRVRNDTPHAISAAFFEARVASFGRSVPWVEDVIVDVIPGGIEPGEEAVLDPSLDDSWYLAPRDRRDLVLDVTLVRLDGADGEPLWRAREFTAEDERQLMELKSDLETLRRETPASPR